MATARTIRFDSSVIRSTAQSIESVAAEYKRNYDQLLNEIDAMAANWQGPDNQSYTNQIKGFVEEFTAMYNLMNEYVDLLNNSATLYENTTTELTNDSKKLYS